MKINIFSICQSLAILLAFVIIPTANLSAQISADDILAKHLNSIGTAENRQAIKSTMIVGTSKASFKGRGAGFAEGIVVLASEGAKNLIGMKFNNTDYPFEMMGYDGDKFSAKQIRPGSRSVLGDFLRLHESVFKGGIMGGTLSQSWSLLNFDDHKGKLKYAGIVTVADKQFHKLNYFPKKGSNLDINFFFDVETFQHQRTEYKRVSASSIGGGVDNSARQSETRYTMIEEFSDFKAENKLNLPHHYRLFLEIISGNGTISYEWTMNLQNFIFNQPIEPNQFNVESY